VKVYGANSGQYGSTRDGQERFWRNVFGGLAAVRFHRPPAGLGLNEIAQAHIHSMRTLADTIDLFSCAPHQNLLRHHSWNEAYCTANPGVEYAVFFPDGGDCVLDISAAAGTALTLRWLDIRASSWGPEATAVQAGAGEANSWLRLVTPTEEGYWAALVQTNASPC
jgi:hypothetical protein